MGCPNIHGFVGYWGSGKSLEMCREACRREKRDPRLIVGNNFDFKGSNTVDLDTLDDVIAFAAWETPGWRKLICLDEIQGYARSRGHTTFPPAAEVVFSQGRKLGLSMLWSSQHWKFVDVYIRRVTDLVTECEGYFYKRLNRGQLPAVTRPRMIRKRHFRHPNPESDTLPANPSSTSWVGFDQEIADRYDTDRLIANFARIMGEQHEKLKDSAIVEVLQLIQSQDNA